MFEGFREKGDVEWRWVNVDRVVHARFCFNLEIIERVGHALPIKGRMNRAVDSNKCI